MILRTDGRLSKCKQRTAILASTVHEMEIVLLSLSSASPFRPSRSLFAFAYGVLLFSCHCFIKDAQFATQGGIIGFVFTVGGLDNGPPRSEERRRGTACVNRCRYWWAPVLNKRHMSTKKPIN